MGDRQSITLDKNLKKCLEGWYVSNALKSEGGIIVSTAWSGAHIVEFNPEHIRPGGLAQLTRIIDESGYRLSSGHLWLGKFYLREIKQV